MKNLTLIMVCWLLMLSCKNDVQKDEMLIQNSVQPDIVPLRDKFNALSFRTFADFRAAVNDASTTDLSQFKSSKSSSFTSLQSKLSNAMALQRNALRKQTAQSIESDIQSISPKVGFSKDAGVYVKVFNPAYARVLNERGLVLIGNDLYEFKDKSFDQIKARDYTAMVSSSVDEILQKAPRTSFEVTTSRIDLSSDNKMATNTLIGVESACGTMIFPQEPRCDVGCYGAQRVEGCLTIYKYNNIIYEWTYTCNYNPGWPTTDAWGNPIPCVDGDCTWPCDYYPLPMGNEIVYDAATSYDGKENYFLVWDWGSSPYMLTSMRLRVTGFSATLYDNTVYGSSYIGWSHAGYAGSSTGSLKAEVYIRDNNSSAFNFNPTTPTITNTVAFY